MRIDPGTCRDADLLAAEVRRLRAVIAAGEPTLTDAEREAILTAIQLCEDITYGGAADQHAADVLRSLLGRLK